MPSRIQKAHQCSKYDCERPMEKEGLCIACWRLARAAGISVEEAVEYSRQRLHEEFERYYAKREVLRLEDLLKMEAASK